MIRDIILYIAMSLDGYIAKTDGSVNWLCGEGNLPNPDNGYQYFYNTIDTVVLGRTTYEQLINELSPDIWVYEGKKCYVATTKDYPLDSKAEFISSDITGFIKSLKSKPGKDIWIVGGGKLIDRFIKENIIDKYIITVIPTILGTGIPLFLNNNPEVKLRLLSTKTVDGMVEVTYCKR